jgi:adenylate kinase
MILIMLGPPGSGKGTQSDVLVKKHGFIKLSTGDMLRREVANNSDLGRVIADVMQKGLLVSDSTIMEAVRAAFAALKPTDKVILDGFPRTLMQADLLKDLCKEIGQRILGVYNFVVEDEAVIERLAGRYQCSHCQATYHDSAMPYAEAKECIECHHFGFYRRPDDAPDVIKRRLEVFHQENQPLVKHYRDLELLIDIKASESPDVVAEKIATSLGSLFA